MKKPPTATPRDHPRPNWRKPPGSIDTLNTSTLYDADNEWDLPDLQPQPPDLAIPPDLFPLRYRQPIRTRRPIILHFHTDDYRFENVWREPHNLLAAAGRPQIWAACSPDFSLWLDWPLAVQLWNTYRNRWCAAHMQAAGITVLPTVNWSTPLTYDFAWLGIPPNQIVTLRTYANADKLEAALFLAGYQAMTHILQPRHILWFGQASTVIDDGIPKTVLQPAWVPTKET